MSSIKLLHGRRSEFGAFYAVTIVTRKRKTPFLDGAAVECLSRELSVLMNEGRADSLAWVAMPDHLHWLFQLRDGSLGECVGRFKSRTARSIGSLTGNAESVWQPGYYDHRLRDEDDLLAQARYLIENPLREGLAGRIEDYPFWSCRWIARHSELA